MTTFSLLSHPMALTGESPLWDPDRQCLWWIDIQAQRLLKTSPEGDTTAIALPSQPGLIALTESHCLVIGLEDGLWTYNPETFAFKQVSDTESERSSVRLNDGKADSAGRLWFGSMDMSGQGLATGKLYRRDVDGQVHCVRENITVPNAIVPVADASGLWFADSPTRELELLELDPQTAAIKSSQTKYLFPEGQHPDGACLDADGLLWVAVIGSGEVLHIDEQGDILNRLQSPVSRATMPMLGGRDGHTLYLTNQRRFLDVTSLADEPEAGGLLQTQVSARSGPIFRVAGL